MLNETSLVLFQMVLASVFLSVFSFGCFGRTELTLPVCMSYKKQYCHNVLHSSDNVRIKIEVGNNLVLKKMNTVVTAAQLFCMINVSLKTLAMLSKNSLLCCF